jgi:PAS domain S-box-containing protein
LINETNKTQNRVDRSIRTSTQIEREIKQHFGFFPPLFTPALSAPQVLDNLWQQTLSAYINNPLPELFKDKLLAYLSQARGVPYFTICHSSNLRSLGMTGSEILELMAMPIPTQEMELSSDLVCLNQYHLLQSSWQSNSIIERCLLRCCAFIFLKPEEANNCHIKVRKFLGLILYSHLVVFLGYIKLCHQWIESHPELTYEEDLRAQLHLGPLLLEEIKLAEFFQNDHFNQRHKLFLDREEEISRVARNWQNSERARKEDRSLISYLLNAPFPMTISTSDGKIVEVNNSWREITGYSIEEVPTIADWIGMGKVKHHEIVRSKNYAIETEEINEDKTYLNGDNNYSRKNRQLAISTRSEVTITTRNGEQRIWDCYTAPLIRLANGEELVFSIASDITSRIHTETQLFASESRLNLLLESTHAGIWDWSIITNKLNLSKKAAEFFAIEDNKAIDTKEAFLAALPREVRGTIDLALEEAIANNSDLQVELKIKQRHLELKGKSIADNCDNPLTLIGIVREVTPQNLVLEEKDESVAINIETQNNPIVENIAPTWQEQTTLAERNPDMESLIDAIPYYVYIVEREGMRISFANKLFANSLGFQDEKEVSGKTVVECFPQQEAEYLLQQYETLFNSGETLHQQETMIVANGQRHHFDTLKIPLKKSNGETYALICTCRDITESIENKQALSERTVQLEAANRELESFSYSVSHDLQAPLRVINGFSQVLLERYLEHFDEKGKHYLQRIRANSQRMGELIDDLLQLSRVTRTEIQRTQVNLSEIAQEIATELRARSPERKVEFVISPGLTAHGDSRLLRIVLDNLLNNAWKYTSKRPDAKIEFTSIQQPNKKIAYLVKDNGAGFDMTYAEKLFIAFQRLHSDTEFPGSGIGLATVKRIVQKHGGQVWAEGSVQGGASFYFNV